VAGLPKDKRKPVLAIDCCAFHCLEFLFAELQAYFLECCGKSSQDSGRHLEMGYPHQDSPGMQIL
jgi:hypothetical protein